MKKTRLRKKSKTSLAKLKHKLWEITRTLIRKRDGNVCVICGQQGLEGSNWHAGHFIPKAACGAYLYHDLRNIHSSCYRCNVNLGGNGALYYKRLVELYSQEWVDKIFEDKNIIIKADEAHYQTLIDKYKEMLSWEVEEIVAYTKAL